MAINVTPIPRLTTFGTPGFTLGTSNAGGDSQIAVASNSTLLAFDAVVPADVVYTGTSVVGSSTVSARRDHAHDGGLNSAAKAWVQFHGTNVIDSNYGVDSITNTATGTYSINFDVAFSSATYSMAQCSAVSRRATSNNSSAMTGAVGRMIYADTGSGAFTNVENTALASVRLAFYGEQ
jgi:flavin-binding protein dodecin